MNDYKMQIQLELHHDLSSEGTLELFNNLRAQGRSTDLRGGSYPVAMPCTPFPQFDSMLSGFPSGNTSKSECNPPI